MWLTITYDVCIRRMGGLCKVVELEGGNMVILGFNLAVFPIDFLACFFHLLQEKAQTLPDATIPNSQN